MRKSMTGSEESKTSKNHTPNLGSSSKPGDKLGQSMHGQSQHGNPSGANPSANTKTMSADKGLERLRRSQTTLDAAKVEAQRTLAPILERMKQARRIKSAEKVLKRMTAILEYPMRMRTALEKGEFVWLLFQFGLNNWRYALCFWYYYYFES